MEWREQLLALKGGDMRRKDASGRTQEDVAALLGVSARSVRRWLNPNDPSEPNRSVQLLISMIYEREN